MNKKEQNKRNQQTYKDRMKAAGFVRWEIWIKPSWKRALKAVLKKKLP